MLMNILSLPAEVVDVKVGRVVVVVLFLSHEVLCLVEADRVVLVPVGGTGYLELNCNMIGLI